MRYKTRFAANRKKTYTAFLLSVIPLLTGCARMAEEMESNPHAIGAMIGSAILASQGKYDAAQQVLEREKTQVELNDKLAESQSAGSTSTSSSGPCVKAGASADDNLTDAVAFGNLTRVKALLASGVNPNTRDGNGRTPLMLSTECSAILQALIDAGADVNATSTDGVPVMLFYTEPDDLHRLIAAGANVNARNREAHSKNDTLLMYYIKNHQPDAIKTLLAAGADVNARNDDGKTALQVASAYHQKDLVQILSRGGKEAPKAITSKKTSDPKTPMVNASSTGGRLDLGNDCETAQARGTAFMDQMAARIKNNKLGVCESAKEHLKLSEMTLQVFTICKSQEGIASGKKMIEESNQAIRGSCSP